MGICLGASLDGSYRGSRIPAGLSVVVLQASINPSPYRLRQLVDASPTPSTHSDLNLLACSLALDISETTHYLIQTVKGAISANCYRKSQTFMSTITALAYWLSPETLQLTRKLEQTATLKTSSSQILLDNILSKRVKQAYGR